MRNSEVGKEVIKKQLPLIPKLPGVYKMLSINNEILYVGKAKNLPNRLKSYVSEKNHIIRTERMLSQTKKLEITTTSNESEALLLEANLIKKHKPKFKVLLKINDNEVEAEGISKQKAEILAAKKMIKIINNLNK